MFLGGLWHGASWNFMIWGGLHGVYLTVNRAFRFFCEKRPRLDALMQSVPGTAARMALTFFCIYQGFVFFRAQSFGGAAAMLRRMWVPAGGDHVHTPLGPDFFWGVVVVVFLAHVAGCRRWWEKVSLRLPAPVLGAAYVFALMLAMVLAPTTEKPFIYFQF